MLGTDHQHQKLMISFWPTTQRCLTGPDKLYIYLLTLLSKGSKSFHTEIIKDLKMAVISMWTKHMHFSKFCFATTVHAIVYVIN